MLATAAEFAIGSIHWVIWLDAKIIPLTRGMHCFAHGSSRLAREALDF
jgi:hypothetical protein